MVSQLQKLKFKQRYTRLLFDEVQEELGEDRLHQLLAELDPC